MLLKNFFIRMSYGLRASNQALRVPSHLPQFEKAQNFWYNIYRKNEGREKLMDDFEMLSPAEQETAIRREYADAQRKINALVHRLMEEYRYFEYLRDQIAEIDALGADNVFGSSEIKEIKASLARNGYDF